MINNMYGNDSLSIGSSSYHAPHDCQIAVHAQDVGLGEARVHPRDAFLTHDGAPPPQQQGPGRRGGPGGPVRQLPQVGGYI